MQSFLTILIAGSTAFTAMFMLNSNPVPQTETYVEREPQEVVLADYGLPSFLLEPNQPLVLALEYTAMFDSSIDIPVNAIGAIQD